MNIFYKKLFLIALSKIKLKRFRFYTWVLFQYKLRLLEIVNIFYACCWQFVWVKEVWFITCFLSCFLRSSWFFLFVLFRSCSSTRKCYPHQFSCLICSKYKMYLSKTDANVWMVLSNIHRISISELLTPFPRVLRNMQIFITCSIWIKTLYCEIVFST